jgi:ABC-type oligopeptide transport system ATPase subunit
LQRQQRLWPPVAHKGQRQQRQRQLHHMQMVLQSVASRLQQLQPQQLLQVVVHLPLVLLVQPVELIKVEKQVLHQLLQQL